MVHTSTTTAEYSCSPHARDGNSNISLGKLKPDFDGGAGANTNLACFTTSGVSAVCASKLTLQSIRQVLSGVAEFMVSRLHQYQHLSHCRSL